MTELSATITEGSLSPSSVTDVLSLATAAQAADGVAPLSEDAVLHVRHGADEAETDGTRDFLLRLTDGTLAGYAQLALGEAEAEARKAEGLGIRVVLTRFGIILAKQGGALPQMMKPFKFFVGGKLGSGRQWMSWVTLDDVIGAIRWALEKDSVNGVFNVVSPKPLRNADFTQELGRALHRPALFTAPAFALRMAMGQEMADEMLLVSERVVPGRLKQLASPFSMKI